MVYSLVILPQRASVRYILGPPRGAGRTALILRTEGSGKYLDIEMGEELIL